MCDIDVQSPEIYQFLHGRLIVVYIQGFRTCSHNSVTLGSLPFIPFRPGQLVLFPVANRQLCETDVQSREIYQFYHGRLIGVYIRFPNVFPQLYHTWITTVTPISSCLACTVPHCQPPNGWLQCQICRNLSVPPRKIDCYIYRKCPNVFPQLYHTWITTVTPNLSCLACTVPHCRPPNGWLQCRICRNLSVPPREIDCYI